jgi:methionine synthase II (cobalamin-independent)
MRPLTTTTIGSFPLSPSLEGFKRSLEIQVKVGIDYPALPQLEDFCAIFLNDMTERGRGIERRGKGYLLTGPVEPPREPAIVRDLASASKILKGLGFEKGIKVQVTGPFTLSSIVKFLDKSAMSYPDIVESFADALAYILSSVASFEIVEVAFVDEPVLYYALWYGYEEKFAIDVLNRAFKGLSQGVERGLHVCGDVRGLSRVTLKLEVDVLHHEFAGFPKNFEAYSPAELAKSNKLLGIGAVTTKPLDSGIKVESVQEVEELLRKSLKLYGPRVIVAPDCGFRGLAEIMESDEAMNVVFQKLKSMVEAVQRIRGEATYQ